MYRLRGGGVSVVVVDSLGPWLSVDSEAIQAGVLWMAPVGENPHLNDLKGLIVLFLIRDDEGREAQEMLANETFHFIPNYITWTGKVCSESPSSWYV